MKNLKVATIATICLFSISFTFGQLIGGKKGGAQVEGDTDGKAVFDAVVQQSRVDARTKLKPFKYDGTQSTYFSYKTYTYAKEVEILTIEKANYKFCFDSKMVTSDKIKVEIWDKPSTANGGVKLYEKEGVGGNDFIAELNDLNEVFRAAKTEYNNTKPESERMSQSLIDKMRLKKVYVRYIIPAVDREVEYIADEAGNQQTTTTIQYSAMVLAVGYENYEL